MSNKLFISLNPGVFHLPIKIITPRIAKNKQNSIFYSGKNIAEVKFLGYEYVLTSTGTYEFYLNEEEINVDNVNNDNSNTKVVKTLTDAKIKKINDNDCSNNWGWFGINVWKKDIYLLDNTDAWAEYDEAMDHFKEYVKEHITNLLTQKE